MPRLFQLCRHYFQLWRRHPGFGRVLIRYGLARICGRGVLVFFLPFWGQYPFLAGLMRKAKPERQLLVLFAVDLAHPTRIREGLLEEGFSAEGIFHFELLPLLPGCDVFLSATQWIYYWPRRNQRLVCIFHGLPTKGNTFRPELIERFTDLFFIGPSHRRLFERTYLSAHAESALKLHEVGYPKLDDLLSGRCDAIGFRSRWRIPQDMPVVLYAPAFDEGTSLREYGLRVIEELLELPAMILVKLHPMLLGSPGEWEATGGVDWKTELEKLEDQPNFRHLTEPDLTPALAAAQVMVTDVSGAALEFMLTGKAVVFLDCPRFFDEYLPRAYGIDGQSARNDPLFNAGRHLGVVAADLAQMKQEVRKLLEKNSPAVSVKPEDVLYHPGRATEEAWRLILEFLSE